MKPGRRISETAPGIPPALAMVVHRCLEKEPEDRFDSARDVAFSLRATSTRGMIAPVVRPRVSKRLRRAAPKAAAIAAVLAIAVVFGAKLTDLGEAPAPAAVAAELPEGG